MRPWLARIFGDVRFRGINLNNNQPTKQKILLTRFFFYLFWFVSFILLFIRSNLKIKIIVIGCCLYSYALFVAMPYREISSKLWQLCFLCLSKFVRSQHPGISSFSVPPPPPHVVPLFTHHFNIYLLLFSLLLYVFVLYRI